MGAFAADRIRAGARVKKRQRINGQFAPRTIVMLRSPAFRVLSLTGHRILARIEIELAAHGGHDNGKLPVTFDDFEDYGISNRNDIARGLREVRALGFVELTRPGRAGNGEFRSANLLRLTYLPAHGKNPTDEWRRIESIEQAEQVACRARKTVTKKQNPSIGKRYWPSIGKRYRSPVSENDTGTPRLPVSENVPLSRQDLSISPLRRGSGQTRGKAGVASRGRDQ